jgi:hypothetical protein
MGEVARATRCPDCGTELTPDLPRGLCARCLLRAGAAADESDDAGHENGDGAGDAPDGRGSGVAADLGVA